MIGSENALNFDNLSLLALLDCISKTLFVDRYFPLYDDAPKLHSFEQKSIIRYGDQVQEGKGSLL